VKDVKSSFAALLIAAILVGCGGGQDGTTALSVPVSSGYPILGSSVTLKGSNGQSVTAKGSDTTGIATFTTSQVGSVGSPPYLLKSTGGTANGQAVPTTSDYYSIATAATGRVNVTPITHMLAVQATGATNSDGMAALFNASGANGFNATKAAGLTTAALETALTSVKETLKATNPLIDLGTDNPLTVVFSFGDAHDGLLDQLKLTLKNAPTGTTLDTIQGLVATKASGGTPNTTAFKPFTRLVVFGDSLSDGGAYTVWASGAASGANRFVGTPGLTALAAAAPYGGKFTTNGGKVWVEHLAASMDYDLKPANLMGGGVTSMNLSLMGCTTCTNYAQGGSRVTLQPGIGNVGTTANLANGAVPQIAFAGNLAGGRVDANAVLLGAATADYSAANAFLGASTLPVVQQIDQHLSSSYVTAGKFAATDLVVVLAGANDVFTQAGLAGGGAITSTAAGTAVATAAGQLAAQVARIKAAGAKHVMVFGLPDMGYTPYGVSAGPTTAGGLTSMSQSVFNPTLKAAVAAISGVAYVDPVPMFAKVVASPATYGFTKTIDATSAATAIGSTACGPNAIAQAAAGDSAASPSSLFCSVPSTSPSIAGTLRAVNADQTYMFADGVHPSAGMHKVFAQLIKDKMGLLLAAALGS
jgi:phospholipase/lecithinase/hemolysin